MEEISILDLQNLRHLIGGCDTNHCKMQAYAQEATSLKQISRGQPKNKGHDK